MHAAASTLTNKPLKPICCTASIGKSASIPINFYLPGTLTEVFGDFPDGVLNLIDDFNCEEFLNTDGSYTYVTDITKSIQESVNLIENSINNLQTAICKNTKIDLIDATTWLVSLSKAEGFLHNYIEQQNCLIIQVIDVS